MIETQLKLYQDRINKEIDDFCDKLVNDFSKQHGTYSEEVIGVYCDMLRRGGKRLRGLLTLVAYDMCGGRDKQLANKLALVVEMIHTYVLIMDDIVDESLTRRDGPTAHRVMQSVFETKNLKGEKKHFGNSQALHAGLAGAHLAQLELNNLETDTRTINSLSRDLQQSLLVAINGQIEDVFFEALSGEVSVDNVLAMNERKTAYYSFLMPLRLGSILAGVVEEEKLHMLREFSLFAGTAYQVEDDLIDLFSDSDASDIKEGKMTYLVAETLSRLTPEQKQDFLSVLGKPNVSEAEAEWFRSVVVDHDVDDSARDLIASMTQKSLETVDSFPPEWRASQVEFLREFVSQLGTRTK